MSFSPSTFTIEIDAVPMVAFQAKWQADADQICKDWLRTHWDELSSTGPRGIELPPIFKLRLARNAEREAYEAEGTGLEICGEVKIVRLVDVAFKDGRAEAEHSTEDALNREGVEDLTAQRDEG